MQAVPEVGPSPDGLSIFDKEEVVDPNQAPASSRRINLEPQLKLIKRTVTTVEEWG